GVVALATAAGGSAQPSGQQVVLPGPVPYPTDSPPLLGKTALPNAYLGPLLHIASGQRVFVGVDSEGRVARVVDRQRLLVRGKGDYQVAISGPAADSGLRDLRRARPRSEAEGPDRGAAAGGGRAAPAGPSAGLVLADARRRAPALLPRRGARKRDAPGAPARPPVAGRPPATP